MGYQVTITTPAGKDLQLESMHGHEKLGRLYQYDVSLLGSSEDIVPEDIIGQSACVNLEQADGEMRYFHGIVSRFSQQGRSVSGAARYSAVIHPWLWMLTRTSDCRMFQELTVPDILKEVFSANGYTDYELKLNGEYRTWEYCAQYRETDFNFVSRLMEQEGIYYYFKHEKDKHILILADSPQSHDPILGESTIPYHLNGLGHKNAMVVNLTSSCELQSGNYALTDYNFKKPKSNLGASRKIQNGHAHNNLEIFDYPGEYTNTGEGEDYALRRIEELQASYKQINAETDCRAMILGGLFTLIDHPSGVQNRKYLVTQCDYELVADGASDAESFHCSMAMIDSKTSHRSKRLTPKPLVHGPQTAIVVDDACDEFGRVKVRFYWDREEQDSCWVRVSQNAAGAGWGSMFVPHVDHEVIVSFYEGDPDRPIITGKVYNADNMPPDLWDGGTSNSVITDHVENKINLDGSGTPIIHITQPSGNEIIMNDNEGIQIRDNYGNEIIMDAVSGTMKMRSPSHESVIVLGQSIFHGTSSDFKSEIKRDWFQTVEGSINSLVYGSKEEYIVGPVTFKYDGINSKIHGGLVQDTFVGAQQSNFYGLKFGTTWGVDYSENKTVKRRKDKEVERDAAVSVRELSPHLQYIAGPSKLILSEANESANLKSGNTELILEHNSDALLCSEGKVNVESSDDATLKSGSADVTIDASKEVLIHARSGNVTLAGSKVYIG